MKVRLIFNRFVFVFTVVTIGIFLTLPVKVIAENENKMSEYDSAGTNLGKTAFIQKTVSNPFVREQKISFQTKKAGFVELWIETPQGELIRNLMASHKKSGRHEISWDGLDELQRRVKNGVYICTLKFDNVRDVHTITVLR